MNSKTKKIITIGTLCAITYVIMAVGRIPVVLFLKYDHRCYRHLRRIDLGADDFLRCSDHCSDY